MKFKFILKKPVALILLVGAGLRVFHFLSLRATPFFENLDTDSVMYDRWAKAIVDGNWIGKFLFYQDPLYPYFLAALYRVFGRDLFIVRCVQIFLGLAVIYLVYRVARQFFGDGAAYAAGTLCAIYKPFIFYDNEVEKTFLGSFLMASFIALYVGRKKWAQLLAGAVLALLCLVRGNALVFIPLCALLAWFAPLDENTRPKSWASAARAVAMLVGVFIVLTPVILRNRWVGGEWVLTTTQSGQNFYIGNNPNNAQGNGHYPPFVRPNPLYLQADFRSMAESRTGQKLSDGQVSLYWWGQSFEHAHTQPEFFIVMMVKKFALFWNDFETPDNQSMYFLGLLSWVLRLPLPTFSLLFMLAAVGAITNCRTRFVGTCAALIGTYALSIVAFFVVSRYRLPIVPVMAILAGASFPGIQRIVSARRWLLLGPVLLGAVSALMISRIRFEEFDPQDDNAHGYLAMSKMYHHEGNIVKQQWCYEKALEWEPYNFVASYRLSNSKYETGDYMAAQQWALKTLALQPGDPPATRLLTKISEALKLNASPRLKSFAQ